MAASLGSRLSRALHRHAGLRLFRFFARPLGAAAPAAGARGAVFRLLPLPEVTAACADPELELDAARVRAAFARGDACVGAFDGDRLAGYCWFACAPVPHLDGVWAEFGPEVVWVYKSFVRPSQRGRGLAPALYGFAETAARPHGRRVSLICVEAHNGPSIAAAWRAGHAPAGVAGYMAGNGGLRAWYSPAVRRHGVRFRPTMSPDTFSISERGQP